MTNRSLKKKQPSAWPWVVGLAVLLLILWGVSDLLRAPERDDSVAIPATLEDSFPPAAIPRPPDAVVAGAGARPLTELAPIVPEDVGEMVLAEGEVLATGNSGFWMLSGGQVLRVDSDRPVRKSDTITVQGVLQPADGARTRQIADEVLSRSPRAEDWTVVLDVKLVEGVPAPVGTVEGD